MNYNFFLHHQRFWCSVRQCARFISLSLCFRSWYVVSLSLLQHNTLSRRAAVAASAAAVVSTSSIGTTTTGSIPISFTSSQQAFASVPESNRTPLGTSMFPATYKPKIDGAWSCPDLKTVLGRSRIGATELSPLQQPTFFMGDTTELYYPSFLFGSWSTKATLKQKTFPYGIDYLPSMSLLEGSPRNRVEEVEHTCIYELHYFSTLPNTWMNQVAVNLGMGIPKSTTIQDRAFNIVSISKAYDQLVPVQEVEWDYRHNPTRLTINFGSGSMTNDLMPLGNRQGQIYLIAHQSEDLEDNSNSAIFACAERSRAIVVAPGDVVVMDTETITEFQRVTDNNVVAISRIAVYLTPNPNSREGVLWQLVGGKAIAFYDYELQMHRINDSLKMIDGSIEDRACVTTPNNIIQCA